MMDRKCPRAKRELSISSYRGCPPENFINDCCGTVIGATKIPESSRMLSEWFFLRPSTLNVWNNILRYPLQHLEPGVEGW